MIHSDERHSATFMSPNLIEPSLAIGSFRLPLIVHQPPPIVYGSFVEDQIMDLLLVSKSAYEPTPFNLLLHSIMYLQLTILTRCLIIT